MATVNTRIDQIQVKGQDATAYFSSTNAGAKFELRLDGWSQWKPATSPYKFTGLAPGVRRLLVRAYSKKGTPDPTPAETEFTILPAAPAPDPTPIPQPPQELPLLKSLTRVSDWNSKLIEGTSSGSITDEADGSIRFRCAAGPVERIELQATGAVGAIPSERIYDWSLFVPSTQQFPTGDWYHTLSQYHGNNQAGYTGGVGVTSADQKLMLRILGGKVTDPSGNRSYEYEKDVPLVALKPNTWMHLRYHVRWSKVADGFAKFWVDGNQLVDIAKIPTASEWADGQMIRCGWYPQSDTVAYDMRIRDYKVYG